MAGYTLDTSAIIALSEQEAGYESVRDVLESGAAISVPFIAMMEVEYRLLRRVPVMAHERILRILSWPIQVVESDPLWRSEAASIKAQGRLSLVDAWVASLALIRDAELVHKDPEFEAVEGLKHLKLPYDGPQRGGRR